MCVSYGFGQVGTLSRETRRGYWILLEQELRQLVLSCLMWVLGIEVGSSQRTVHTLSFWAIPPALTNFFYTSLVILIPSAYPNSQWCLDFLEVVEFTFFIFVISGWWWPILNCSTGIYLCGFIWPPNPVFCNHPFYHIACFYLFFSFLK